MATLLFPSFGMGQGQKEGTEAGHDFLSGVHLSLPSLGRRGWKSSLRRLRIWGTGRVGKDQRGKTIKQNQSGYLARPQTKKLWKSSHSWSG